MSRPACTAYALHASLRRLNGVLSRRTPSNNISSRTSSRPSHSSPLTSWQQCRTSQQHPSPSHTHGSSVLSPRESLRSMSSEQNGVIITENLHSSSFGPVGQKTKDLQEYAASVAATSEGSPHSVYASQKKSRSTPARLAGRERRMPSRRFQGNRTRLEITSKQGKDKQSGEKILVSTSTSDRGHEGSGWAQPPKKPSGRVFGSKETLSEVVKASPSHEQAKPQIEPWGIQKNALKDKFGEQGWSPRKRLSPDALEGIRTLHSRYPATYSTPVLAEHFKVSPEAIRRILKSKWRPNEDEDEARKWRWEKRGESIWTEMSEKGIKPPKKWRQKGIGRLAERSGPRPTRRGNSELEADIGTESGQGIIATRAGGEQGRQKSLATRIL